jgi:NTP pyrophosphatase (non-canonical NTP hydrolase)
MDSIARLQQDLTHFAEERNWEQYHTPRNLAALIASEAGELLALFRWDQDAMRDNPDRVAHELADVFLGVLRFAERCGYRSRRRRGRETQAQCSKVSGRTDVGTGQAVMKDVTR